MPRIKRPDFITDANHIKTSLRSARIGCGINQTEFAKIMGKSQGWVSQVENGEIKLSIDDACWWYENCNARLMVCGKN